MIKTTRKTPVLKHPALPCLASDYTINLLSGCPYECRYCYTQSFASHPGWGKAVFYSNTFDLLKHELPRKRHKPRRVYFSTACEPFVDVPEVIDRLYAVMKLLLEHDIRLLISTKSVIPSRFVELFQNHRSRVFVQVGLTTVDDQIRQWIEPQATNVPDRLNTLKTLVQRAIPCEVRADPLIPELTDTENNLREMISAIAKCGVKGLAASYLFLRHANIRPLSQLCNERFSFNDMAKRIYTHRIDNYCGSSSIRITALDYRSKKYEQLRFWGREFAVAVRLCRCKNPDAVDECCHPKNNSKNETNGQLEMAL